MEVPPNKQIGLVLQYRWIRQLPKVPSWKECQREDPACPHHVISHILPCLCSLITRVPSHLLLPAGWLLNHLHIVHVLHTCPGQAVSGSASQGHVGEMRHSMAPPLWSPATDWSGLHAAVACTFFLQASLAQHILEQHASLWLQPAGLALPWALPQEKQVAVGAEDSPSCPLSLSKTPASLGHLSHPLLPEAAATHCHLQPLSSPFFPLQV